MTERKSRSYSVVLVIILIASLILFSLNLMLGSVSITLSDFFDTIMYGHDNTYRAIIIDYRLPQALTAVVAGAGLAVSGLLMQTLFRNPLADPSILGISSGAGLGVALVVLFASSFAGRAISQLAWWPTLGLTLSAFIGAFFVLLLILTLSAKLKSMVSLILTGIMIAYITGAITDMLKFFSSKEDIHSFVIWGLGSFSNVGHNHIVFLSISIAVGIVASMLLSKPLNLLLLGERYAENLGLNIKRCNILVILIAGYLTALITAYCGPIAFLGLAVPHIARFLFRTSDHRILIPATTLCGINIALFCNLISRLPGFDGNLPINSVSAMIGAPIVIWVIFYRKKHITR